MLLQDILMDTLIIIYLLSISHHDFHYTPIIQQSSITTSDRISLDFITVDPKFSSPIVNMTAPVGRDAFLTCVVQDLGPYKVSPPSPQIR